MFEIVDVDRVFTPERARLADQVAHVQQLCDQLRRARAALVDLPYVVREQLRIDCIALADAAHELTRLEKGAA